MSSKYEPLEAFLSQRRVDEIQATFEEIERIVGFKLPDAAHTHRAWWSNNPSNNVMTKSWLAAGYRTERVDMAGRKVVFRRAGAGGPGSPPRPPSVQAGSSAGAQASVLDRLWEALAGTVRIPEGADLTEPTGEIWDAETS